MKNHLSMLPSMGAGGRFSLRGMAASWAWSTRSGEFSTVVLALCRLASNPQNRIHACRTHRLISPRGVLPVTSFSQASEHSRMTSSAYFLFLHSPEKANWFSGFPSGIL